MATDTQVFANLDGHQFMSLTTYRKTGQAVPTPVWFVADGSKLYVMTMGDSGKAKRIRNTGRVMVAPCKANGEVLGEAADGQARLLSAEEGKRANGLLNRKYGVMKRLFDLVHVVRGQVKQRVYLEISPR
jgi:uncharacterized protein